MTDWRQWAIGLLALTNSVYPPTLGLGDVGNPSLYANAILLLPAAMLAVVAVLGRVWERLTLPAGLLLASAAWLSVTSLQASEPLVGVVRGGWFFAVALALVWAVGELGFQVALRSITIGCAVFIALGLALYPVADVLTPTENLFDEPIFPWPRFRGLGANQTVIGFTGVLVTVAAVSLRRSLNFWLRCALMGLGVVGVLASHNRSAFLALALAMPIYFVPDLVRRNREAAVAALALIAGVMLLLPTFDLESVAVRQQSEEQPSFWNSSGPEVLTGRGAVWQTAIDLGSDSPLTGRGNGTFSDFSADEFEVLRTTWDPTHAHNMWLELFVDQGLVGILIFALAIFAAVRHPARLPRVGAAIIGAVLLHGLVESTFYGSPTARWMFLVVVCAAVAARTDQDEYPDTRGDEDPRRVTEQHLFSASA